MSELPFIKPHISDNQLIDEYKRTENASVMETLFLRYSHVVFLVSMKYLKNKEESQDAVMDVFQKLLSDCKRCEIKNFPAWLHTVTKNHCLMVLRKFNKTGIEYFPSDEIDTMVMENEEFDTLIDEREINLNTMLENLSEKQKSCLKLFYFDKKRYKEIAQINGMEIYQVKSHIQNGKRNLKNLLKKEK